MFPGYVNFYRQFIQEFSQIAAPLISMLKTVSTKSDEPRKGGDRVGDDSRVGRGQSKIDGSEIDNVEVNSGKIEVELDEDEKKV